jgi:hypothetical protein
MRSINSLMMGLAENGMKRIGALNVISSPNTVGRKDKLLKNVILDEMRRMTRRPAYSAAVCREAPVPKRRSM